MHPNGGLVVALGAAAGGGLVAALGAQSLRAAFHAHAEYMTQPHVLLECLNRSVWSHSAGDQLAGMWCAALEAGDGSILYAWAGRPGMLRLRHEGQELLCEPQLALGLEPRHGYARQQTSLEPGEALVVFSESIRAALDDCGRPLDLAALTTMLIDHLSASAAELSELVRAFLESHSLDPGSEDRGVLVIKRMV
jgi:serine phosphatase RsbU (regulator of sigma subunit)